MSTHVGRGAPLAHPATPLAGLPLSEGQARRLFEAASGLIGDPAEGLRKRAASARSASAAPAAQAKERGDT